MITAERPSSSKAGTPAKKPGVNVQALIDRGSSTLDESAPKVPSPAPLDVNALLKEHFVQLRLPQYLINQIARCRVEQRKKKGRHKKVSQHAFLVDSITTAIEECQKEYGFTFTPEETCPPGED